MRSVESQLGIIPLCPFLNSVFFPAFLMNTVTYLSVRHHVAKRWFSCKQIRYDTWKLLRFHAKCESNIMWAHNSKPSLSFCMCVYEHALIHRLIQHTYFCHMYTHNHTKIYAHLLVCLWIYTYIWALTDMCKYRHTFLLKIMQFKGKLSWI
jgi:hypothetical protein